MKKNLTLLLLMGLPFVFFSQKQFDGGIKAGLVTTQMSGDGLAGWNKFGFAGGGWIRAPFSEHLNGNMAIQFINKGSHTKQDTIDFISFAYKLNYIEMPLGLGYKLNDHWMFTLGVSAAFLISQKQTVNGYDYPVDPPFKSYDVGGYAAITFFMGEFWAIELHGSSSVIPIRPSPNYANPLSFYERGNYNQVLQFMLARAF